MAAFWLLVVLALAVLIAEGFSFPAGSTQAESDTELKKMPDVSPEDVSLKSAFELLQSLDSVLALHAKEGHLAAKEVEIDAALGLGNVLLHKPKGLQTKSGSHHNVSKNLQHDLSDASYNMRNDHVHHNVSNSHQQEKMHYNQKSDSSDKVSHGHQDYALSQNMSSKSHQDDADYQDDSLSHDQMSSKGYQHDSMSHDYMSNSH
ncbi:uncharacterized protein LOC133469581 [Phyllopteryx taeniolatus]|uniref:uncharacterized protein LOC133469581 n=1 Tax=Phyllopteryx taeniolatus TaxID=161469 RepID=UPI002AD30992|nr:uncharacterized protein LOC133469581 [Phyllopteryx taeniolatus]